MTVLSSVQQIVKPRNQWWFKSTSRLVTAIDPAIGQKRTSCYTGIVTLGWDISVEQPVIWVVDARQGHWKPTQTLDQAYTAYTTYEPDDVVIEAVAFQYVFVDLQVERSANRDYSMRLHPIEPQTYGKHKGVRLTKTAKFFQQKRVAFDPKSVMQGKLIEQIVTFDGKENSQTDLMDAFCLALNHLDSRHKPMRKGQNTDEYEPVRVQGRVVSYRKRIL